jgi:nucleoside-diphosphate-sugar epimerase
MRVFVTGASGFIGSALVRELLAAGHEVVGLARSEAAAKKLVAAGASAHAGSIEDLESVRRGVQGADGAIHTAFFHALGHMSFGTRLRVLLGGSPTKIMERFVGAAVRVDRGVITTLGEALGGDRPLVAPFGMLGMTPGRLATEDTAYDPQSWGGVRSANERVLEALASRGVRAVSIRLPPIVHGQHDGGFSKLLFTQAKKNGQSAWVGDGNNRWSSVHVTDAARLFRLALEKGAAGAKYHGIAEEGIPFRQIAEVIGKQAGVPATSIPVATSKHFSFLSGIVGIDNPASSALTRERLGWTPSGAGLLADLDRPDYFA